MLVLSRKINDSIITSNGLRIKVIAIRGDKIRLGFEAPESIAIYRQEVFDRIVKEDPK